MTPVQQCLIDECLNSRDVLNELIENEEFLKVKEALNSKVLSFTTRKQICPRCQFESRTSFQFNYCPDCNWDRLTDQSNTNTNAIAELAA